MVRTIRKNWEDKATERIMRKLRHFGITAFNRAVGGDIMLTKAYARHREISSTQVYVHTSKEELYRGIDSAFSESKLILNR